MTANDNTTNVVKLKKKKKKEELKKETSKPSILASVFLRGHDVCIFFPVPQYTLVLRPKAAYDLALLILSAIKTGAERFLKDDNNDED